MSYNIREKMHNTQYNMANNQLKELKDAFDVFDADRSGEISADELRNVLKSLDLESGEEEVQQLMKAMDRNGDGSIQFHEFAIQMGGSKYYVKKGKNDILSAFRRYDKDNNGSISVNELYQVMKEFRGNLTMKEVRELVKQVDKDGNGSINIAEFMALMSL